MQERTHRIHRVDTATGTLGDTVLDYIVDRVVVDPAATLPLLFGGRSSVGADQSGRIYITDVEAYRISVFDSHGELVRRIEPGYEPRPITSAHRERYASRVREFFLRNRYPDGDAQQRRLIEGRLGNAVPVHFPVTGELLVAASGAFWVERVDLADDPSIGELRQTLSQALSDAEALHASHWDRFDADGELLGTVELPSRFRPMHVNGNEVVGVLRDDLDVEYVAGYRVAGKH